VVNEPFIKYSSIIAVRQLSFALSLAEICKIQGRFCGKLKIYQVLTPL